MGRTSKWPGKDEMWLECARWRSGGLTYDQIEARLSTGEYRRKFDLIEVPKSDTIRYQLKRRRLTTRPAPTSGVLAEDELESHRRGLIHFGVLLRARAWAPGYGERPGRRDLALVLELSPWSGFHDGRVRAWDVPEAQRVEELEVEEQWPDGLGDPRLHPLHRYFMAHLNSTERGSEIAGRLEGIYVAAASYLPTASRFLNAAKSEAKAVTHDTQRGTSIARTAYVDQLTARLHPTDAKPVVKRAGPRHGQSVPPEEVPEAVRSAAHALEEAWKPLSEAITAWKQSVTPVHILMRVVRDGHCEICE